MPVTLLCLAFACCAAALASPPRWTAPQRLACPAGDDGGVAVTVTTRGVRVIVGTVGWSTKGACAGDDRLRGLLTVVGPHGAIRVQQQMSERLAADPVALAGGRVAMLTFRPGRSRTPTSVIGLGALILRVGLPERVLDGPGEVLARNVEGGEDKLEVDGRGDLAIGWQTLAGTAVTPVVEVRIAGRRSDASGYRTSLTTGAPEPSPGGRAATC